MSLSPLFDVLTIFENFYWSYIGFTAVIMGGIYFSVKSGWYQFRVIARPLQTLKAIQSVSRIGEGLSPFRLYFASVGGMVGLGNVVGVVTAVMIGGPGALLWLWIAAFSGMLIKYSEIYLGMKFRKPNPAGGFDGGPMVYLREAFGSPIVGRIAASLFCGLMVIYSIEIYQFVVVVDVISDTWSLNRTIVMLAYLAITLYAGLGGMSRLANISTLLVPFFIIGYVFLCLYVIFQSLHTLPSLLSTVFTSAFTGHAATGGFLGSTMLMAIQQGTSRAVYSGDLGIGYDSIIQSESRAHYPGAQASLSIFGVVTDMLICTLSILVVLTSGIWQTSTPAFKAVGDVFAGHYTLADQFMGVVITIAGFTTVIAYLAVGQKIMTHLFKTWGRRTYTFLAITMFVSFSYLEQHDVLLLMSLSGGFLMVTNLTGIWKLRHHIKFHIGNE